MGRRSGNPVSSVKSDFALCHFRANCSFFLSFRAEPKAQSRHEVAVAKSIKNYHCEDRSDAAFPVPANLWRGSNLIFLKTAITKSGYGMACTHFIDSSIIRQVVLLTNQKDYSQSGILLRCSFLIYTHTHIYTYIYIYITSSHRQFIKAHSPFD